MSWLESVEPRIAAVQHELQHGDEVVTAMGARSEDPALAIPRRIRWRLNGYSAAAARSDSADTWSTSTITSAGTPARRAAARIGSGDGAS